MNIITTPLKFILLSSANPAALSSTLKSFSAIIVPAVMWYYGLDENLAGEIVSNFITVISLMLSAIFLLRKIVLTVTGKNVNL